MACQPTGWFSAILLDLLRADTIIFSISSFSLYKVSSNSGLKMPVSCSTSNQKRVSSASSITMLILLKNSAFVRIFMCSLKSKFRSCSIYSVNYSIIRLSVSVIPLFNLPLFRHSVIQPSFVKRAFPICSEKGSFHSLYIIGKGTCPAHSVLLRKGIRRLSMFVMRFMQSLALGGTRCKGKPIF